MTTEQTLAKSLFTTINEGTPTETVKPIDFINHLIDTNPELTFEDARELIYKLVGTKTLTITNTYRLKLV